jgi:hypothetical protein
MQIFRINTNYSFIPKIIMLEKINMSLSKVISLMSAGFQRAHIPYTMFLV